MADKYTLVKTCDGDHADHTPPGVWAVSEQTVDSEGELNMDYACPEHPGSNLGLPIIVQKEPA